MTIKVSGLSLLLAILLFAGWLIGVRLIGAGLNLECLDRYFTRQGELFEGVLCATRAGPAGWFLLAWIAAFPVLSGWWLRKKLSKARSAAD